MDLALRKSYRTQLTKLIKGTNVYLTLSNEQIDVKEIPVFIARIQPVQDCLKKVNEQILPTIDEEKLDGECERCIEYDDSAVACIARLQQVNSRDSCTNATVSSERQQANKSNENKRNQSQESDNASKNNKEVRQNRKSVRLLKHDLITFDGNVHSRPAFWEQYKIHIHDNVDLDDIAKFSYLRSLLTGQADMTIKGLTSSQMSYNDAIDMLIEEYGNSELIVDSYIQDLLSLAPVKNKNDVSSLRKLYNTTLAITR